MEIKIRYGKYRITESRDMDITADYMKAEPHSAVQNMRLALYQDWGSQRDNDLHQDWLDSAPISEIVAWLLDGAEGPQRPEIFRVECNRADGGHETVDWLGRKDLRRRLPFLLQDPVMAIVTLPDFYRLELVIDLTEWVITPAYK